MANHLLTNVGVYALIIENKKVLFFHKPNDPLWTILGGRMDDSDSSCEIALHREVEEESQIDLEVGEVIDTVIWDINGKSKRLGLFYSCKRKDKNQEIKLSDEHDEFKFFSYDEAVEMLSQEERGKHGIKLLNKLKEKEMI